MPLTGPRKLDRRGSHVVEEEVDVAANTVIYSGQLVVVNTAGYLVPGSEAATHRKAAVASVDNIDGKVDNTGGAAGAKRCRILYGIFPFKSGTSGDAIVVTDRELDCYVIDDETVGKTNPGGNTRSVAGKIVDVDADGVWVSMQKA